MLYATVLVLFSGCALLWLWFVIEAFDQSLGQGLLTLLVPYYVFYFMFVRSRRTTAPAVMLSAMTAIWLAATILDVWLGT